MNIALLQLLPLEPNNGRLKKYLQSCKKQKVQIAAFSEYIFQPFYKEITKDSKDFAKSCAKLLSHLHKLSVSYHLDIVAPILLCEKGKVYKSIALIQGERVQFYHQQRLIGYSHWTERAFFDNVLPNSPKTPLVFEKEGIKIGIIAGFEIHFDEIWLKLKSAKVDVVIMPCSNTFDSKERWRILCQARAFNSSMVILRLNAINSLSYDGVIWQFYGDSMFVNADGRIKDSLDNREGVMLVELEKLYIETIQKEWGFR